MKQSINILVFLLLTSLSCTSKPKTSVAYSSAVVQYVEAQREVMERYNTIDFNTKEFLPLSLVDELMSPHAISLTPTLTDTNYNHCIEHQRNFWEIVKNGIKIAHDAQNISWLNSSQKSEYRLTTAQMLAQITRYKGTVCNIDSSDYNNKKTFLFFEKLVKYRYNHKKIFTQKKGVTTERSELFGRNYKHMKALDEKCKQYPFIIDFAEDLYRSGLRFLVEPEDSVEANKISMEVVDSWLNRNRATSDLWRYANFGEEKYVNMTVFYYWRGNDLYVKTTIDPHGKTSEKDYSPVGSTIIHELVHLMQKDPASKERPTDNQRFRVHSYGGQLTNYISELGPTLIELVIDDYIYKRIHNIPLDTEVDYGYLDSKRNISIGKLCVWFAKKLEKYPNMGMEQILLQDDVFYDLQQMSLPSKDRDPNFTF